MNPFNPFSSSSAEGGEDRLTRLGYGMTSPLWFPFLAAAGAGVAFWTVTKMMRGEYTSLLPLVSPPKADATPTAADLTAIGAIDGPLQPAGKPSIEAVNDSSPAAEPDTAPRKIERVENVMAHNPPPVEAGRSEPADTAPKPSVPSEHVLDHTPPETVEMAGNPEVERRIAQAQPSSDPDFLGEEPGGRAGLLAETSATVLGEAAHLGDVRAEETSEALVADEDAIDSLADAAYAENFGPVPTAPAATGGRSRKGKVRPGTAPGS